MVSVPVLVLLCGAALALAAQEPARTGAFRINFPADSPVTLVSADWGESRTSTLGGALAIELRTALTLRNSSPQRVRGVTLLVLAQEVAPGGKASVSVPSLDVRAGETFPVRIDLRLLHPVRSGGALVEVGLDGVLFEDLSFYGPNRLNSRRAMTVWELEARRDRQHWKSVLEARGPEGLRQEVLASLARQSERAGLDVQVSRRGRVTAAGAEQERHFAFLHLPGAPLEPVSGLVRVSGNEARAARLEVLNRSSRPVRYFEIGWIIRDRQGREFLAGSVPAADPALRLGPGQKGVAAEDATLRFALRPGQPLSIDTITGFVSQAEFDDGQIWIPDRAALADPKLSRLLPPSPEQQRLADLYRKRGLAALLSELKKF
ncbi:MAG: hypothetical protein FJW34_01275 [Acidobacteria bacterium]|nr:hypothetical protein [Acidobacteriota bacterium]